MILSTIGDALITGKNLLASANIENPTFDSETLLSHVLNSSRFHLLLDKSQPLSQVLQQDYLKLLRQRATGTPLQYILEEQYFMGLPFYVNHHVLIPRSETELLCEQVLLYGNSLHQPCLKVLDLCTGSGALAISIAKALPTAKVDACDISFEALEVSKKNAVSLQATVSFYQGDFLQAISGKQYDIIVSNPPYIPTKDMVSLQEEVKQEPRIALDGGEDGLFFYQKLAQQGKKHLLPHGRIFCEIGYDQGEKVPELFHHHGFNQVKVLKDLQHLHRMVIAY